MDPVSVMKSALVVGFWSKPNRGRSVLEAEKVTVIVVRGPGFDTTTRSGTIEWLVLLLLAVIVVVVKVVGFSLGLIATLLGIITSADFVGEIFSVLQTSLVVNVIKLVVPPAI